MADDPTPPPREDDDRYSERADGDRPRRLRREEFEDEEDEQQRSRRRRRRLRDEDDEDNRIRSRREKQGVEPEEFLIPTNVSACAIGSCYMGLVGFCLPLVGLIFAIPAVIMGIIALRQHKKMNTYGGATSNIRAIIGLCLGGTAVLVWGGLLILMVLVKR